MFLIILGLLLAAPSGAAWFFVFQPFGTPPFPRQVEITPGMGWREVASRMEQEGLVRSRTALLALAVLRGGDARVRAGGYRIDGPMTPAALLDKLTRGEVLFHRITVPEGWTLAQVADRLAGDGLVDRTQFLRETRDPARVQELLGIAAPSLEGFLFPDTYHFPAKTPQERVIRTMTRRFQQAFDAALQARAEEMGWTVLQVVTLASLIEKETGLASERPLISGVFHLRLRIGMRLEADPSVIYGLEGFTGDLRRQDLANPHPYNTYVITGLPPGPICNPGADSLRAALFPAKGDYLYFVSRNDGSHHFSKTIQEHARAVARYQKAPADRRGDAAPNKKRASSSEKERPPDPPTPALTFEERRI
jgi:UPF0755 protein